MSFRRRVVLLAAGAVALAVVLASVVVYVVTRNELIGQVDLALRGKPRSVQFQVGPGLPDLVRLKREGRLPANAVADLGLALAGGGVAASGSVSAPAGAHSGAPGQVKVEGNSARASSPAGTHAAPQVIERSVTRTAPAGSGRAGGAPPPAGLLAHVLAAERALSPAELATATKLVLPPEKLGGATGYVQLYRSGGPLVHSESRGSLLPVTAATREVAAGKRGAFFSNVTVGGTPVRMLTERAGAGDAVWQIALPLTDVNRTLSSLRLVLALVCLGGIALAAGLGLLVSRAALAPVRRLTGAAERVARTQDLGHRMAAGRDDELGRLAGSFNTMLAALQRSRVAQRQLIADASHELRTPLTSVQANVDALALGDRLAPSERARVLAALQAQLSELNALVGDVVSLSKGEVEEVELEDVRLDLAAAQAVERAQLHAPQCSFALDARPALVRAAPARLDRAIANLLDNACAWNPRGGPPIEVRVREGTVSVRDHGPGIAAEDLPRVFDRFYRAPAARARPGSGLGLAIVRQVAESHGGAVHAANDPAGGARLTIELPALAPLDAELSGEPLHQAPRSL